MGGRHRRINCGCHTGCGRLVVFSRKTYALTEKDTIVLADFTNRTGDTVFDDTLRQGLSVQLEQSPFLSIFSDQQIQQTLQMMARSRIQSSPPTLHGNFASEQRAQPSSTVP